MTETVVSRNGYQRLLGAGVAFFALVVAGCGNNAPRPPAEKAEKALELFLDAWSRGEPPEKFADPEQPVHGRDPDWQAGYRLLSFLSTEARQSPEMLDHVRCRVALSLQDRKGTKWNKEVVYDVRLDEKSVITRASP
jgi:hypothetical protein